MKFMPEAGSFKTLGSERVVPLHPAVLKEGFLVFVSKSMPGPLFPEHYLRTVGSHLVFEQSIGRIISDANSCRTTLSACSDLVPDRAQGAAWESGFSVHHNVTVRISSACTSTPVKGIVVAVSSASKKLEILLHDAERPERKCQIWQQKPDFGHLEQIRFGGDADRH